MLGTTPPEALFTVRETRALDRALMVLDGAGDRDAARRSVSDVLDMLQPSDAEEQLTLIAMAKIAGTEELALDVKFPRKGSHERRLFANIAQAWTLWARGENEEASRTLRENPKEDVARKGGSATQLLSFHYWNGAVEALLREDPDEARKLFLRAIELGFQIGSVSVPAIQWCYAASFFDR